MIESVSIITVIGLGLTALIMAMKWYDKFNNDAELKKKGFKDDWKKARQSSDRTGMLNILERLRRKKS